MDGINAIDIKYPKVSNTLTTPPTIHQITYDISGTWLGEFLDDEILNKVTLQINQSLDSLFGSSVISYTKEEKQTVIQEIMNGSVKENSVIELHGVNYTYIERGDSIDYNLDSFILSFN